MNTLILVWLHYVADFLLQTDTMALNKSKSWFWLTVHCIVYASPFLYFGLRFAVVNGVLHLITDALTSRASAWAWQKGKRGLFFKIVGLDQAIHLTTLYLTLPLSS